MKDKVEVIYQFNKSVANLSAKYADTKPEIVEIANKLLKSIRADDNQARFSEVQKKLLNSLSELADDLSKLNQGDLSVAGLQAWEGAVELANLVLPTRSIYTEDRCYSTEDSELIDETIKSIREVITQPDNIASSEQLKINAEKIRTRIEGGFLDREEGRIWRVFLYGGLMVLVGAAMLAAGIILFPIVISLPLIAVFFALCTILLSGGGAAGVLAGTATSVYCAIANEPEDEKISRLATKKFVNLSNVHVGLFKSKQENVSKQLEDNAYPNLVVFMTPPN